MFAPRVVAIAALLAACSSSSETIESAAKKWAPIVEPRLAVAEQIAKQPLPANAPRYAGPALDVMGGGEKGGPKGNSLLVLEADLPDLSRAAYDATRGPGTTLLGDCYSVIRAKRILLEEHGTNTIELQAAHIPMFCEPVSKAAYLVVLHKLGTWGVGANSDGKTFAGDQVRGELHVFDLATGKHLGIRPFEAATDSSITVYGDQNANDRVWANLMSRVAEAVDAALAAT